MTARFDVIVAGCGAVGSAALYQVARRGAKALGIDRFTPPHDRGSSHGETRITRLALGEGAEYFQFVRRSHEIWRELEAATGRSLLEQVGGLIYGSQSNRAETHGAEDFLGTTIKVAEKNHIPHEVLDAADLVKRFPQFRFCGNEVGYHEPEAGYVRPEHCIAAQLETAIKLGAILHSSETLIEWSPMKGAIRVTTNRGDYETDQLILTAGPWLLPLVPRLPSVARVMRQVLFWFQPEDPVEEFLPNRMPVFIRVPDRETEMFYGFPVAAGSGSGLKIAGEQFDRTVTPEDMDRAVSASEIAAMHAQAAPHLRITSRCVHAAACMYTVTPGFRFAIDRYPGSERVWFASACSGHGFKHSAGVGEALAEAALGISPTFDLAPFAL